MVTDHYVHLRLSAYAVSAASELMCVQNQILGIVESNSWNSGIDHLRTRARTFAVSATRPAIVTCSQSFAIEPAARS